MTAENRQVIVVSGLVSAGKSRLLEGLVPNYPGEKTTVITTDGVQQKYWGPFGSSPLLTPTERVYKNELAWSEVMTALIVERAQTVLFEAVMLTRDRHQRPFREMIDRSQEYLQAIARERGELPPRVDLNVIMLYCDVDTIRQRMIAREQGASGVVNPDAASLVDFVNGARLFELPDLKIYRAMPINNSYGTERQTLEEAKQFLRTGVIDPKVYGQRMLEAAQFLEQARRLVT